MNIIAKILSSSRIYKNTILVIADTVCFIMSFLLAFVIRGDLTLRYVDHYRSTIVIIIGGWVLIKLLVYYLAKVYRTIIHYASVECVVTVTLASITASTLCFVYSYIFKYFMFGSWGYPIPRSIYLMDFILATCFTVVYRFSYRFAVEFRSRFTHNGRDSKKSNALIYGAGVAGNLILREYKMDTKFNYNIVGFVDDDKSKTGRFIQNIKVLGTGEDLERIIKKHRVKEVIIAIPSASGETLQGITKTLRGARIRPKTMPSLFSVISGVKRMQDIQDIGIEDLLRRNPEELDLQATKKLVEGEVVLITGAGGSIGSELTRQVAMNQPAMIVLYEFSEFNLYKISMELEEQHPEVKVVPILGDVKNRLKLERVFLDYSPTLVFHAAAYKHVPLLEIKENIEAGIQNNVMGTLNAVELSDRHKVKKFVLISTDKAVNPSSIMGRTKQICEKIVKDHNSRAKDTKFIIVRFGNVIGSSGSVIPRFIEQINSRKPVTVTHREATRYFMLISEAVALILQAASLGSGGEVFILDMGRPINIYEMAKELIEIMGLIPEVDLPVQITGLRPGEKLHEELILKGSEEQTRIKNLFVAKGENGSHFDLQKEIKLIFSESRFNDFDYSQSLNC